MSFSLITRAHTVDEIAEELHRRVLSGELPVGSRIVQEAIAQDFAVSRQPVREAIRKLEATGLVVHVPNCGAVVRGFTVREVLERYQIRGELEGLACRLAAIAPSDAFLTALEETQEGFARSVTDGDDPQSARLAWRQANDRFHETILEASGNALLREQVTTLHRTIPRNLSVRTFEHDRSLLDRGIEEHAAIIRAIAAADPEVARTRMIYHVISSGAQIAEELARHGVAAI